MKKLQRKLTTDEEPRLRSIRAQHYANSASVVIVPDTHETSFEQLAQELYPTHHDIRKRPR